MNSPTIVGTIGGGGTYSSTTLSNPSIAGSISGTPTASGAWTFSGAGTALTVTNNASVGGALGVTGVATLSGGGALPNNKTITFADTSGSITNTIGTTSGNLWKITGSGSGGGARDIMSFPMHDATNTVTWGTPQLYRGTLLLSNAFAYTTTATPLFQINSTGQTGTITSGSSIWNAFTIASDSVNTTTGGSAPGTIRTLYVASNIGGLTLTGSRGNLVSVLNMNSATNNVAGAPWFYVGLISNVTASANDGGTGLAANGNLFGENILSQITNGATFWNSVVGSEIDVGVQTGASTSYVIGMQIVRFLNDTQQGTQGKDNALQFANSPSGTSPGWNKAISFGAANGWWPMNAAGTMIGTDPGYAGSPAYQAAYGIDFSAVTFATAFLKSTGFLVNGSGVLTLSATGTALSVTNTAQAAAFKTSTALITAVDGGLTAAFTANMVGSTGGPTTAAQNGWVKMLDSTGATVWVPVWK